MPCAMFTRLVRRELAEKKKKKGNIIYISIQYNSGTPKVGHTKWESRDNKYLNLAFRCCE